MKHTRQGVFETNSSSTHSITICGEDKYEYPKFLGTIRFGQYGWEQESYYGFDSKLSYVITMLATKNQVNTLEEFFKLQEYTWLKEAVKQHCGQELVIEACNDNWSPLGYVDHQSDDVLDEFLVSDEEGFKIKVLDFVFNEKYSFETDNDNH